MKSVLLTLAAFVVGLIFMFVGLPIVLYFLDDSTPQEREQRRVEQVQREEARARRRNEPLASFEYRATSTIEFDGHGPNRRERQKTTVTFDTDGPLSLVTHAQREGEDAWDRLYPHIINPILNQTGFRGVNKEVAYYDGPHLIGYYHDPDYYGGELQVRTTSCPGDIDSTCTRSLTIYGPWQSVGSIDTPIRRLMNN